MKRRAQILGTVLGGVLLCAPLPLRATALDDLINAAGQGLPNVPDASPPQRVDGEDTGDSDYDYGEEERLRQAQEQAAREQREKEERERQRLEQERLEKERQRLERERLAREEQERLRREAEARRARLRQQAAAAHQHWLGEDERNRAAFDDVFADSGTAAAEGDPGAVDLSNARALVPTLLRGAPTPQPSLRIKAPPLPPPEFTVPAGTEAPEPAVLPFWRPDWERKLADMGFAYASMYLKARIDGLGSIPEMLKDSLDLKKKLGRRFTDHLENVFATAQLATRPDADLGALSDRAERQFRSFAAAVDEDARNGIRDTIATTGGGALGDGAEAAEFGIAAGREHLQDLQELEKWCADNPARRRGTRP